MLRLSEVNLTIELGLLIKIEKLLIVKHLVYEWSR